MRIIIFSLLVFCASVMIVKAELRCRLQKIVERGGAINPSKEMCSYLPFKGSVGKIIADFKPTTIARATKDHSAFLLNSMKSLIGLIPVAGSYITMAYDISSKLLAEPQDSVVNRVMRELQTQIKALKSYVDAKVKQIEYTRLTHQLAGLLAGGRACADYDKPDQIVDLERCLISLNTRVVGFVLRFMATDDSILTYEWSLPFFRQYGDLQLTITQDLLRIALRLKKNSAAEDYAKRLRDQSRMFYNYAKKTVNKIIKTFTTFKQRKCEIYKTFQNNVHQIIHGMCTQELYKGRVCTEEVNVGLPIHSNYRPYYNKAYFLSHTCHKSQVDNIKANLMNDLTNYWELELMGAAKYWYKVSKEADKLYIILSK